MLFAIVNAFMARARAWWRSRVPTREAVVVSALLVVLFEACYLAAFFVRSELLLRASDTETIMSTVGVVVLVKFLVFYWRGLAHRPWRAARFEDLNRLLRATTTALFLLVAYNFFLGAGRAAIPRSVLLMDWAFTLLAVGGMQAIARSVYEEIMPATQVGNARNALVIDASPQGRSLARALADMRGGGYWVAGLLDDDPDTYGVRVGNARVLGPVAMAPACAERLRASVIVIRQGAVYGSRLRALCDACAALDVRVCIAENVEAPEALSRIAKRYVVPPLRIRDVELRDLLSRPQAHFSSTDADVLPFLQGRTILVTGAGGSIGAEICRQVVRFAPAKILLVERSEIALFTIHQELAESDLLGSTELLPLLCDITHADRIEQVFAEHRPAVVFHAAAYKHVPLMEAHPIEAIENNALATATLAEIANAQGVQNFVTLSTDKAVQPTSIMGASKLVAERFLQAFNATSSTRFAVVRFGNVLGSSGSAVPVFTERLARRLPIKITHPEVRRYFMTIDEAAELVLMAGALASRGGTFVLAMGESLPIVDLVSSLAFVMNIPPHDVRIEYCGLRPGEKLDEELFFGDERRTATSNPLVIRASRPPRPLAEVRQWLGDLKSAVAGGDVHGAAQTLMGIVAGDCEGVAAIADAGFPPHSADAVVERE